MLQKGLFDHASNIYTLSNAKFSPRGDYDLLVYLSLLLSSNLQPQDAAITPRQHEILPHSKPIPTIYLLMSEESVDTCRQLLPQFETPSTTRRCPVKRPSLPNHATRNLN